MIHIVQPLALANEYPAGNRLCQGAEVGFPALKLPTQRRVLGPFSNFGKHWNLAVLAFPLCRTTRGADLARPSKRRGLPTSGRYCNCNLVERRVSNVIGFNLRISVNYRGEDLRHFWISCAVVGLGILGFVPQTDCERFRPALSDERDFVLESFLFSKQGEDVLL